MILFIWIVIRFYLIQNLRGLLCYKFLELDSYLIQDLLFVHLYTGLVMLIICQIVYEITNYSDFSLFVVFYLSIIHLSQSFLYVLLSFFFLPFLSLFYHPILHHLYTLQLTEVHIQLKKNNNKRTKLNRGSQFISSPYITILLQRIQNTDLYCLVNENLNQSIKTQGHMPSTCHCQYA